MSRSSRHILVLRQSTSEQRLSSSDILSNIPQLDLQLLFLSSFVSGYLSRSMSSGFYLTFSGMCLSTKPSLSGQFEMLLSMLALRSRPFPLKDRLKLFGIPVCDLFKRVVSSSSISKKSSSSAISSAIDCIGISYSSSLSVSKFRKSQVYSSWPNSLSEKRLHRCPWF